jgi:Xaa-Pro aminopeptidase
VTVALREAIAKRLGARRLLNTTGVVAELRLTKDAAEIALIAKAVRAQESALGAVLDDLAPGQSERALATRLIAEMSERGSSEPAFDVIVAARANGSLPHAIPGATKTKVGEPLLIDWGATIGGYRSDMTRTFTLGRWKREMREIYEVTLEAQLEAIERIGPGVRCAEVDAAARDIIEEAGYGDRFGHGLGHGVGLDIHEGPRLARTSEDVLAPGMVVTVEPGIYLPGIGGVRIEDLVVVTERGRRNLSTLPKDLDWATR